mgnify:CR=1 FL=1
MPKTVLGDFFCSSLFEGFSDYILELGVCEKYSFGYSLNIVFGEDSISFVDIFAVVGFVGVAK